VAHDGSALLGLLIGSAASRRDRLKSQPEARSAAFIIRDAKGHAPAYAADRQPVKEEARRIASHVPKLLGRLYGASKQFSSAKKQD
jgi:hypothetical protein